MSITIRRSPNNATAFSYTSCPIVSADYQRARRPEQKLERREAILAAARELATERPVREISLGDIAREVGLAKSNLLRYFDSREEIFLRLLLREWEAWNEACAARLGTAEVAAALAATLAERPLFCDLTSEMSAVLERNVTAETTREFKAESLDRVDALGVEVHERLPALTPARAREIVAAALIITAGLWPIANPAPHVTAVFAEHPELMRAHVRFEARLEGLLTTLVRGFLSEAA
jgi:AcrR family transcriptional regulator